jgi:hypothetical protein
VFWRVSVTPVCPRRPVHVDVADLSDRDGGGDRGAKLLLLDGLCGSIYRRGFGDKSVPLVMFGLDGYYACRQDLSAWSLLLLAAHGAAAEYPAICQVEGLDYKQGSVLGLALS